MRRFLVKLVAVLLILSVCLLAFGAWALHDEDFLKARVARIVEAQTGRQLSIDGPFRLEVGRRTTLNAGGVRFANAPWAQEPSMVSVGSLRITLDIPSLLDRAVWLADLGLSDCTVNLGKNGDGEANWNLSEAGDEDGSESGWTFRIDKLDIDRCRLVFDSPARRQPLRVEVDQARLNRSNGTRVTGEIDGRLDDDALTVNGWMDPPRAFSDGGPVAMELGITTGEVTLDVSASFTDAALLSGPELDGRFQGPEIGEVLDRFALPPISEGDFDFRVHLVNQGGQAIIDVNGDLGSLEALAQGELDRLAGPTAGQVTASLHGPDLQALGQALGLNAPLGKDFELDTRLAFTPDTIRLEHGRLQTGADRVQLSGTLSRATGRTGTKLDVSLHSQEAGRWLAWAGRPEVSIGALTVDGTASVDGRGDLRIDSRVEHAGAVLELNGGLGPFARPLVPDLDLRLRADDLATLGTLLETDRLPHAPVDLAGHVKRQAETLELTGFALGLDGNRARLDGTLDLDRALEGIELHAELDIPDLATLGALFDKPELPTGPVKITGTLKRDGKQLTFAVDDGDLGDIRVDLDGHIADLDQPTRVDANFELHFPSANTVATLLPGLLLPEGPMSATGKLRNLSDRTRIDHLLLRVAQTEATVDGHVGHDRSFDLKIGFSGPDLSELQELAGISFPALPFDLSTGVSGNLQDMAFQDLYLRMGPSEAQGDLRYQHGAVKRISGTLFGRRVNLTHWIHAEQADDDRETGKAAQRYVFDDTPVLHWSDLGWAADVRVKAEELEIGYGKYHDLDIGFLLAGPRAEVKPFAVTPNGGGRFRGELVIDGASGVPELEFQLGAENYPLQLVAAEGQDPSTLPVARFSIDLDGKGRTHREMAASLEGKMRLSVGPGDMAPSSMGFLLSDFVTELFRVLIPWRESYDYTRLKCAVAAADVHEGMLKLDPLVVNTRQVTIISQGTIDLETEHIDLAFNSKQRRGLGISASDLVNPFIKIGGTLAAPAIELDPASTVVKGGLAVATMGISILAGSLADRYLSSKDPCGDAQKAIDKRDAESNGAGQSP